jgi:hypothetical protein
MGIKDVIGRKLGLDVRDRDVAADADLQPFKHFREPEIDVHHGKVITFPIVFAVELPARDAIGIGVAVILAVDGGEPEAPIEMIGLDRIGQAVNVEHGLIELAHIGVDGMRR